MKTTTLTILMLLAATSVFAQTPATAPTSVTDQYNDLSEEGKAYMKMYIEKTSNFKRKQYLQTLHDDWVKKSVSANDITRSYTKLATEIYNKSIDAAYDFFTHIPHGQVTPTMNAVPSNIKNTIRKKAQATVDEFERTRNNNANTSATPATTAPTQPPETIQKPVPVNPLVSYIGKVYYLDIHNPYGKTASYKTRFYIFGYDRQNLKGIVEYDNSILRTKTTITINAPYYYEYGKFHYANFENKTPLGTCNRDIAICGTCGGNGNSSKQKDYRKVRSPDHFNKTYETTYRTYYECGKCGGKGVLNK